MIDVPNVVLRVRHERLLYVVDAHPHGLEIVEQDHEGEDHWGEEWQMWSRRVRISRVRIRR